MEINFKSKSDEPFLFRNLGSSDAEKLGSFFESLSEATRSKYGPHLLTKEHASFLCKTLGNDNVTRFIILNRSEIVGYFILDFNYYEHESARYCTHGIELNSKLDPVFAPCIADAYQNKGIASGAMKILINYAKSINLRSIVLMGGTQEPNLLAQGFYKNFGFKEYSRFYTDYNHLNNIDMMLTLT